MSKQAIIVALLPLALSTAAMAAGSDTYVGVTAGQSQMLGNGLSTNTGNEFGVFLGHDFTRWAGITWGGEVSYNTLGNFSGLGVNGHSSEADASLIATYYLDPANRLGIYGKVGYDHTWVSVAGGTQSEDGAAYGAGLRYFFTRQVEGRFGYQYYAVGGSNLLSNHESSWALGAAYHF